MDSFFARFFDAIKVANGYQLADTLLPSPPRQDQERLRKFYRSTNAANVKKDVQYSILYDRSSKYKLETEEGTAWVDVYVAYWNALGEIIRAEDSDPSQVSRSSRHSGMDLCHVFAGN